MTDIVEKLRRLAQEKAQKTTDTGAFEYLEWQAAEEITLLRQRLEENRKKEDLVERLRSEKSVADAYALCREAAGEIENLREKNKQTSKSLSDAINPKYLGREDED